MDNNKKQNFPKVTIAIPVQNGERFLEEAIKSVLNQTFTDLELIITDNGSTDKTPEICKKYTLIDERVRFESCKENIGASKNFNKGFRLSQGKYFQWLAHDDYIHPTFIEKAVEILDKYCTINLVYSKTKAVNENRETIQDYSSDVKINSEHPSKRLYESICRSHPLMEVFGLMRSSALKETKLIGNFSSSDRVLLAEMALLGKAELIPEYLFFNRLHPHQHYKVYTTRQTRGEWFDPKLKNKITFPHWRLMWEFIKSVRRSPVKGREKGKCYFVVCIWIRSKLGYLIRNILYLDSQWRSKKNY